MLFLLINYNIVVFENRKNTAPVSFCSNSLLASLSRAVCRALYSLCTAFVAASQHAHPAPSLNSQMKQPSPSHLQRQRGSTEGWQSATVCGVWLIISYWAWQKQRQHFWTSGGCRPSSCLQQRLEGGQSFKNAVVSMHQRTSCSN